MSSRDIEESLLETGSRSDDRPATFSQSVVILSKTIVGAGAAALPYSFQMLGLVPSLIFLGIVAFMTHYSVEALASSTVCTGSFSYPKCVQELSGMKASKLLDLALVGRCSGLMIVYIIVVADLLCGNSKLPGILPELFGPSFGNRALVAGCVTVLILLPICTPKRLSKTKVSSAIGFISVVLWCLMTVILAGLALSKGEAHKVPLFPDWSHISNNAHHGTLTKDVIILLATIPVIATAYTCQMTVHFVMKDLEGFSQQRMSHVSVCADGYLSFCVFLVCLGGNFASAKIMFWHF